MVLQVPSGLQIDLAAGIASGDGQDSLVSIEDVVGSRHADEISGTDGPNAISSSTGDDTVYGLAGDDQLNDDGGYRSTPGVVGPIGRENDRTFKRPCLPARFAVVILYPCEWAASAASRHISSSCPPVGPKRDRGFGRSGHGDVKNQTERR